MSSNANLRAVLGSGPFRRLLGVRVISQFGDGLFQAALAGGLLFNPEKATSALAVAAGFAILLVPYSVVGPFVGPCRPVPARDRATGVPAASVRRERPVTRRLSACHRTETCAQSSVAAPSGGCSGYG